LLTSLSRLDSCQEVSHPLLCRLLVPLTFLIGDRTACNINSANSRLLKATLTAGLYPNVVKVEYPETRYQAVVAGAIAGRELQLSFPIIIEGAGLVLQS
jgi:hypothetical protein